MPPSDRQAPPQEPWHAQALANAYGLQEAGVITAAEWSDALGAAIKRAQAAGDPDKGDTYYLHVLDALETLMREKGLVDYDSYAPKGYSYYLRGQNGAVRDGNAYIVGDAAALSTRDMCEGICPAVSSGLLAAKSIVSGTDYRVDSLNTLSGAGWVSKMLEQRFAGEAGRANG